MIKNCEYLFLSELKYKFPSKKTGANSSELLFKTSKFMGSLNFKLLLFSSVFSFKSLKLNALIFIIQINNTIAIPKFKKLHINPIL